MLLVVPLVLVLILWYLVICYKWKKNLFNVMEKMPGPRWYPLVGTSHVFFNTTRETVIYKFLEVIASYQPFFRKWNGNIGEIHLTKPEHLQIVLRSSTHTPKGQFYDYLFPWLGEGLFLAEGAKWFMQRKLLTPTFHFKILEGFTEIFAEKTVRLVHALDSKVDGKYFNIVPDVACCTLSVICETSMGVPIEKITDDPVAYVKNIYGITEMAMWRYWRPYICDTLYYLLPQGRRYKQHMKELHAFSNRVIKLRKERPDKYIPKPEDLENETDQNDVCKHKNISLMDLLIDATDNQNVMSESDMKSLVDTFLLAGYETTANSICWALFLLGNNPDMQERAYKEVRSVLKGKEAPSSIAELNELKYIECIAKEAIRLYPVLPFVTRTTTEKMEIDGYEIPVGIQAVAHIFFVHRDPEIYPNPNKFDPERFTPENAKARHPYAYIPFSAGPRNCLGMRFALLEMKSFISTIINRFKITSLEKEEDIKVYAHMLIRPHNGINVRLEHR